MNSALHQTLLSCGYKYTPARQIPKGTLLNTKSRRKGYYVKDYSTKVGIFPIALILLDDPHIKLPIAYILQLPESCKGRLIPHISHECNLCYVAQMEADWDPNDLDSTYRDVDAQIQLTLNNAIASAENGDSNNSELDGEFFAYWEPEVTLYLLDKPGKQSILSTCLSESTWLDGSLRKEYITTTPSQGGDNDEMIKWLIQRKLTVESLTYVGIATHYIKIKPSRLSGVVWPPGSFSELLAWLAKIDHNARDRVIQSILSNIKKRHVFLLDVTRQDTLAVYVEIDLNAADLSRHRRKGAGKSSLRHLASIFSAKSTCLEFKRLHVINADRDTLLSRNLPRPGIGNLSGKRIALIGCGTIGGYLAALLLRSGAGCGDQHFDLYDNDILSAHNFGRHILSAHEFGQNKASALADNLMRSVHIARNIKGVESLFPITKEKLADYDIVIDATGRPPVSKRLAAITRTIPKEQQPKLIHAFNDGNGRASKVFVDDGTCCYGCLLSDPTIYREDIDLRFENIDQELERHISCGSTYTPYDAAVSHITAALAQEAVLNTLEPEMPWTYNEHMLDASRSKKPRFIKHQPSCKICNDRR